MKMLGTRNALIATAVCATLLMAACIQGEKVPPKGSTITVSGNPVTIPLVSDPNCINALQVTSCGTSDVIATVSNDVGVPLPDQDVRFSATAGRLFLGTLSSPTDASNLPIRTDSFGNAHVKLATAVTATVTARSGTASGTLTLNTVPGNLSSILLTLDPNGGCSPNNTNLNSCGQPVCLVAKAQDSQGGGIPGVVIIFKLVPNSTGNSELKGSLNPLQGTTNTDTDTPILGYQKGQLPTKFTPDPNICDSTHCGGGNSCRGDIIATTQGGALSSSPVPITLSAP